MKNLPSILVSISIFLTISISSIAQINDTVSHVGNDCLGKDYVNDFQFYFENDSLFISGEVLMNCWDHNYLFREVKQDSIFLIAADTCIDNCVCHFDFSTSLIAPVYEQIYLSVGYLCLIDDYQYVHYFDTVIARPDVGIGLIEMKNTHVVLSPSPVIKMLSIRLEDSDEFIKSIKVFQINGREVYDKFYDQKLSHLSIDLSQFNQGIYLMQIESNMETFIKKIIKI